MKYFLVLIFTIYLSTPPQKSKETNKSGTLLEISSTLINEWPLLSVTTLKKAGIYVHSAINHTISNVAPVSGMVFARLRASLNLMTTFLEEDKPDTFTIDRSSRKKTIAKNSLKLNFKYQRSVDSFQLDSTNAAANQLNDIDVFDGYDNGSYLVIKSKDTETELVRLTALIDVYLDTQNIKLAYSTYARLLQIFTRYKANSLTKLDPLFVNHILLVHGKILYADKKYEKSLEALKKINIKVYKPNNFFVTTYNNPLREAYVDNHIIDTVLNVAKTNSNMTTLPLQFVFTKNELFAQIYFAKKDYETAKKYIDTTFKFLHGKHISSHPYIYGMLAQIEKNKGHYEKAFAYYMLKDSLSSLKEKKRYILLNSTIKSELARLKEGNKNQNVFFKKNIDFLVKIILLLVLIALAALAVIYIYKEEKVQELNRELEFNKKITEEKKKFLENLSHEIKTPISIIIGYLNLIKNNIINTTKIVSYSEKTIATSEHMIDSLNNFLTLSKLDGVELKTMNTLKPFRSALEALIFSFEARAAIKNQGFYYKSNIKLDVSIRSDYECLKKIIFNLLENAIKYTQTEKAIYVTSDIEEKDFIFTVSDEGVGIANNELETIFSRFQQTEKNSESGGFGIGLSLVHELVTKMNGIVSVKSEVGIGSIFTVRIPLEIKHQTLYVHAAPQEYQCLHDARGQRQLTVKNNLPKALIIDDNLEMISYYKDMLSSKLNCTFAFNGLMGLETAKKQQFDIVISDYKMPQMGGIEFKTALNTLENYQDIPFIMITASPLNIDKKKELTIGINDYITKPFSNEEIFARIHNLLERTIYKNKIENIEEEDVVNFSNAYTALIEKINGIIVLNFSNEKFNVKLLAKECGFSPQHLTLVLKNKTGLTPAKLILEIRLLKAYEYILKHTYQTLNEVIYAVGLSSRAYFNKVFLKRFGIKPNDLVKKVK